MEARAPPDRVHLAVRVSEFRIQRVFLRRITLGQMLVLVIATWKAIFYIHISQEGFSFMNGLPGTQAVILHAAAGAGFGGVRVVHRVPDHVPSGPVVAGQLLPEVLAVKVGHVTTPDFLGLGPD